MNLQTLFWFLILVAVVELLTLLSLSKVMVNIAKSEFFGEKLKRLKEKKAQDAAKAVATILVMGSAISLGAQPYEPVVSEPGFFDTLSMDVIWVLLGMDLLLLVLILYMRKQISNLLHVDKTEEEQIEESVFVSKVMQSLTDVVPVEKEDSILMHHEYDGIQELDNNLPPWWKWGFVVSIIYAVVYLLHFHVFQTGMSQEEAYKTEVAQAEIEIQEYLESQALNVDENSATLMANAKDLKAGRNTFMEFCKVCHGANGEGLVGPNLTDDYWIYGNDIKNVFKTIKYGAKNGMKSWQDELNPVQMQQVASYVISLQGTNPANPKDPQGEYYAPPSVVPADSTEGAAANPSDALEAVKEDVEA